MSFIKFYTTAMIIISFTAPVQSEEAITGRIDTIRTPNLGTGKIIDNFSISPSTADAMEMANISGGELASYERAAIPMLSDGSFVPFSVVDTDDRKAYSNTTEFPGRTIAKIIFQTPNGDKSFCTGTLISPDTILTAGHCVHTGGLTGDWHKDIRVFPGFNKGTQPYGECGATKLYALDAWIGLDISDDNREFDLGAIKLDCTVGERTGWMGLGILIKDDEPVLNTVVHGYSSKACGNKALSIAGFSNIQWISRDYVRHLRPLKAFYQNDTCGGTSGSPVYVESENTIFCVHTNGLHNGAPWNENNACTRITPQRAAVISHWINSGEVD